MCSRWPRARLVSHAILRAVIELCAVGHHQIHTISCSSSSVQRPQAPLSPQAHKSNPLSLPTNPLAGCMIELYRLQSLNKGSPVRMPCCQFVCCRFRGVVTWCQQPLRGASSCKMLCLHTLRVHTHACCVGSALRYHLARWGMRTLR